MAYLTDNNTAIAEGLYYDYKDAIDTAYAKGLADGAVNPPSNVEVTYRIIHTHGDYCYPVGTMTNRTVTKKFTSAANHGDWDAERNNGMTTIK